MYKYIQIHYVQEKLNSCVKAGSEHLKETVTAFKLTIFTFICGNEISLVQTLHLKGQAS